MCMLLGWATCLHTVLLSTYDAIGLQLITIDEHQSRIYQYLLDDDVVTDKTQDSDVIVLHEIVAPVLQSRHSVVEKGDHIVVPVYHLTQDGSGRSHKFGHPSFVAIDTTQQNQIATILEAIALNNTAWVRKDMVDNLFEPTISSKEIDSAAASLTSPSKKRPAKKLYEVEIMNNRSNLLGGTSRRPELWSGDGDSRTTLSERLKAGGNVGLIGTAHRAVNGIGGMMGLSNPPSDNEDDAPHIKRFLRADEGLAVVWNVEQAREFFGFDYRGGNEWEPLEDPDVAAARAKSSRKNAIDIEDCLAEFSRPEVLGEQDLWYCSNVRRRCDPCRGQLNPSAI